MAVYGQDYDEIRRRNQSFFPNANPGAGNMGFGQAPGVATGQARMNEIASNSTYKSRRANLATYTLPSGATVRQPMGSSLPSGFSQAQGQPSGTLNAPFYSDMPNINLSTGRPLQNTGGFVNAIQPTRSPANPVTTGIGNLFNQFSNMHSQFFGGNNNSFQSNPYTMNRQRNQNLGIPPRYFD